MIINYSTYSLNSHKSAFLVDSVVPLLIPSLVALLFHRVFGCPMCPTFSTCHASEKCLTNVLRHFATQHAQAMGELSEAGGQT